MCRKYPGRRCGNPVHERVEALRLQVEEAKAFRDGLNPDVVRRGEINEATRRITVLENRLKEAQARYDISNAGYAELEAAAKDESLSRAERTALKVRLKDAEKTRAQMAKVLSDAEARRTNVMLFLEEAGVPASERADFSDENIYRPAAGSAAHYARIKDNRLKACEVREAEFHKAMAKAQTPAEKARVEEKEGLALARAKSDYNKALYTYDSTSAGIEALRAKRAKAAATCYTDKQVVALARLEQRLANAERAHRLNLDARNYRTAKLRHLIATVRAHGGDVDGAVAAFKNKTAPPKDTRRLPAEALRERKVFAHMTTRDIEAVDAAFRQSEDYQRWGEAGRARFLERKVLAPPHERYLSEGLAEANARVIIGSNGKTGRNNTTVEGGRGIARSKKLSLNLTNEAAAIVKARANFLNTTVSTYMDRMLRDQNPAAWQNDRSAAHRAKKYAKMSEIIANGVVAA